MLFLYYFFRVVNPSQANIIREKKSRGREKKEKEKNATMSTLASFLFLRTEEQHQSHLLINYIYTAYPSKHATGHPPLIDTSGN